MNTPGWQTRPQIGGAGLLPHCWVGCPKFVQRLCVCAGAEQAVCPVSLVNFYLRPAASRTAAQNETTTPSPEGPSSGGVVVVYPGGHTHTPTSPSDRVTPGSPLRSGRTGFRWDFTLGAPPARCHGGGGRCGRLLISAAPLCRMNGPESTGWHGDTSARFH